MYFFRSDPRRNGATVILTVDVNSFEGECQSLRPGPDPPTVHIPCCRPRLESRGVGLGR